MYAYTINKPENPIEKEMELDRLEAEKMEMERAIRLIRAYRTRLTVKRKTLENLTKAYCRSICELEKRIDDITGYGQ